MKTPARDQLIANQLHQLDTLGRQALYALRQAEDCERQGFPADYYRGQCAGYQLAAALVATDLCIATFVHWGPIHKQEAA